MTDESINRLARSLVDALPASLRAMQRDLEENFRAVLRSGLSRLDLVTREEFEVQQAVLARTREKLDLLERKLDDIEKASTSAAGKSKKKKKSAAGKAPGRGAS